MTPEQLAETTASLFGVVLADLFSDSRVARTAEARMALAWALRQNNWSLEAIGEYLGRDHTTIIYGLARIEERATKDARLAERLKILDDPLVSQPIAWQTRIIELERRVLALEALIGETQHA